MPCWDCWEQILSCINLLFICWEYLSSSRSWHSILQLTELVMSVAPVPLIISIAINWSAGFTFAVSHFSLTGLQRYCWDYQWRARWNYTTEKDKILFLTPDTHVVWEHPLTVDLLSNYLHVTLLRLKLKPFFVIVIVNCARWNKLHTLNWIVSLKGREHTVSVPVTYRSPLPATTMIMRPEQQ